MVDSFASEIEAFIVANCPFGQRRDRSSKDQSFLKSGDIDSTGLLQLVSFVEQRYGIWAGDRELVRDNLDSVRNISQFETPKLDIVAARS